MCRDAIVYSIVSIRRSVVGSVRRSMTSRQLVDMSRLQQLTQAMLLIFVEVIIVSASSSSSLSVDDGGRILNFTMPGIDLFIK